MTNKRIDLVEGNGMRLWDQQPGEPASAYSYFLRFLYMQNYMDKREITELARLCDKSVQTLYGYSREFAWRDRAAAHDKYFAEERFKDKEAIRSHVEDTITVSATRLLKRFTEDIEDLLDTRAKATAEVFAASYEEEMGLPGKGKLEVLVKADMSIWKDAANAFATLAKEARIAVGLPTNITERKGKVEHVHSFEDVVKAQREKQPQLGDGLDEASFINEGLIFDDGPFKQEDSLINEDHFFEEGPILDGDDDDEDEVSFKKEAQE